MDVSRLAEHIVDARQRTLDLVADLTDEEMLGPKLRIVNPPLWEIGHVAWFQEHWALQHVHGFPPIREDGDRLYDSAAVSHDTRWDLLLPSRAETIAYMEEVRDRAIEIVQSPSITPEDIYFNLLSVFHEDMHTEAFTYTRQTHAYPPPACWSRGVVEHGSDGLEGDAEVQGGTFMLGAVQDDNFVFDNEKWAHPVEVEPFRIARAAVTQEGFARFVDDGGYSRNEFWHGDGIQWKETAGAQHPVYWRRGGSGWERRDFDKWIPLEPHQPVIHVNWYEADAYCRWAGRRLPTEAEWEMAASWDSKTGRKLRFPWRDDEPTPERANLDWLSGGVIDVGALPEGDSPCGCRQMIGNVWEWTSTDFHPYPGFVVDPYNEYSEPWFYDHKVLRGGCWTTRSRLIRNTWRNFYRPDRRDVLAGFRTCALD